MNTRLSSAAAALGSPRSSEVGKAGARNGEGVYSAASGNYVPPSASVLGDNDSDDSAFGNNNTVIGGAQTRGHGTVLGSGAGLAVSHDCWIEKMRGDACNAAGTNAAAAASLPRGDHQGVYPGGAGQDGGAEVGGEGRRNSAKSPVFTEGGPWWALDENTRGHGRRKPYYHFASVSGGGGGEGKSSYKSGGDWGFRGDRGTVGGFGGRGSGGWSSYARLPYNVSEVALWSSPVTVVATQLTRGEGKYCENKYSYGAGGGAGGGGFVAAGSADGAFAVWNPTTGVVVRAASGGWGAGGGGCGGSGEMALTALGFLSDAAVSEVGGGGGGAESLVPSSSPAASAAASAVAFASSTLVVGGTRGGGVAVWDATTVGCVFLLVVHLNHRIMHEFITTLAVLLHRTLCSRVSVAFLVTLYTGRRVALPKRKEKNDQPTRRGRACSRRRGHTPAPSPPPGPRLRAARPWPAPPPARWWDRRWHSRPRPPPPTAALGYGTSARGPARRRRPSPVTEVGGFP